MIEFKPFETKHALELHGKAADDLFNMLKEDYIYKTSEFKKVGFAYSVFFRGKLVAVWGIRNVRTGLGEPWIVIAQDAPESPKLFRALRDMVSITERVGGFCRLRAASRKGFDKSQRLLEFMGFRRTRRSMKHYYLYTKRC